MRRRILLAIIGVTIVATTALTVPLGIIVANREHNDASRELDRIAERTAAGLPPTLPATGEPIELPPVESVISVAIYDPSGVRVAGNGPDPADALTASASDVTVDGADGGARILARPIIVDEQRIGVIRVAEPLAESASRIRRDLMFLLAIDVGAVLIAAAVGWIVAARLVRPLRVIRDDAVRLGHGDFSIHPAPSGVTELDETSNALAETARRLDGAMTREREFSANASHQLRTPITALRLAIESEMLTPRADPNQVFEESLGELDRLECTIETLLAVARDQPLHREPIDVASIVTGVHGRWDGSLAERGRPLRIGTTGHPSAHVSADVLDQIVDVLIGNAAAHGSGAVTITLNEEASNLVVTVSDEGGICRPPSELFVRRDPSADGYGVGLALARSLAESEGGRLTLARSSPTTFRVVLPDLNAEATLEPFTGR